MTTAMHDRTTYPRPVRRGAETMEALVHVEDATTPEDVVRLAEIDKPADAHRSIRKVSFTAGVGLLFMSVISAFGYLVAVKGLVVPGNAARTARNITGHEGLFRFGILMLYLVAALDVVVAWALCRVFKPVSDALSK